MVPFFSGLSSIKRGVQCWPAGQPGQDGRATSQYGYDGRATGAVTYACLRAASVNRIGLHPKDSLLVGPCHTPRHHVWQKVAGLNTINDIAEYSSSVLSLRIRDVTQAQRLLEFVLVEHLVRSIPGDPQVQKQVYQQLQRLRLRSLPPYRLQYVDIVAGPTPVRTIETPNVVRLILEQEPDRPVAVRDDFLASVDERSLRMHEVGQHESLLVGPE